MVICESLAQTFRSHWPEMFTAANRWNLLPLLTNEKNEVDDLQNKRQ